MRRIFASLLGLCAAIILTLGASPAHAGVDDFSYDSWDGVYSLSLDHDGRAVMRVTETIVPVFPKTDQNRGIVRGLPLRFGGAPAAPEQITVTDGSGRAVPFETTDEDEFRVILVGDDEFVHGTQTYVISYTIHDPILAATETAADEFYWDVLPFERQQPITAFSATVKLAPEFTQALTGNMACYTGPSGSTFPCELVASGANATVPPMAVAPGSGVTVAIGFHPSTVAQPPERLPSFVLDALPTLLAVAAAVTGAVGTAIVVRLRARRQTAHGTIIAQYDVPASLPPLIAGPIVGARGPALSAQLVHLSVTGVTRFEVKAHEAGALSADGTRPAIRLVNPELANDPLDRSTVRALFRKQPAGSMCEIPKHSEKFASRMRTLTASGVAAATARGYFTREHAPAGRILGVIALTLAAASATLWLLSLSREPHAGTFFSVLLGAAALIGGTISVLPHTVHTREGAEAREYLEGVREFIRVADADRIQMLQSFSGAERLPEGDTRIVHVYERLLPYAMLFGLEKEWSRVLETQYAEQDLASPTWYPNLVLASAPLSRSLTQLSSTFTSAASYSSSSSGGSSGGGFSGGGGGGGFSGGR